MGPLNEGINESDQNIEVKIIRIKNVYIKRLCLKF